MTLFDKFKKKKKTVAKKENASEKVKKEEKALAPGTIRVDQSAAGGEVNALIIRNPRITEKASFITEEGAYTFDIDPRANKLQVKKAIKEIYEVTPVKVNIVTIPAKRIVVRNKTGVRSGGKKAIVYLKDGDRIEFV